MSGSSGGGWRFAFSRRWFGYLAFAIAFAIVRAVWSVVLSAGAVTLALA